MSLIETYVVSTHSSQLALSHYVAGKNDSSSKPGIILPHDVIHPSELLARVLIPFYTPALRLAEIGEKEYSNPPHHPQ